MSFHRVRPGIYISPDRRYRITRRIDGWWVLDSNPLGDIPYYTEGKFRTYRDAVAMYTEGLVETRKEEILV